MISSSISLTNLDRLHCMRSEIRSEIPQMDLHGLITIIPPTLRTFHLLWHNLLPIITLDCQISGEIERYTGSYYRLVLFSSLDLSRSFTLSSISLAFFLLSLALSLALSLLSLAQYLSIVRS